jgi:hypothetical protein
VKRRWLLGIVLLLLALSADPVSAVNESPSMVEVSIPDYEVTTAGNLDYVEIPGGEILLAEEGRPRVPYFIKSIDYPQGYRVQDVILKERSGLKTATGLKLPMVLHEDSPAVPITMKEGRYPEKDYEWRVLDNTDGSTTLIIAMYPFYYQPETTGVEFYKNYYFNIEYVASSVTITGLTTTTGIYAPGCQIPININLRNSGDEQDIIASIAIKRYDTGELVDGLPLRSLKNIAGNASVSMEWDSINAELGYYKAEATLMDDNGNILDRDEIGFTLQLNNIPEEPAPTPTTAILTPASSTPMPKPASSFLKSYFIGIIIAAVIIAGAIVFLFVRMARKKAS